MTLTLEQKQTLKTWLLANAGQLNDQQAADALNAPADPAYYVYRASVSQEEIYRNGFDWTAVDNLSVGKARIWDWMFSTDGTVNPSNAAIRSGINECWKGTAQALANRATIYTHCYDLASVADQLLAVSGDGTMPDTSGDGPAVRGYDSQITPQDVIDSYNV